MARRAAIVGVGYTEYCSIRRQTREKGELGREAIRQALNGTGLALRDVDLVVYTTVDGFEGWNRNERLLPIFGQNFGVPTVSVNTGGTGGVSALKEAYNFIKAGLYDVALVFAASTFDSAVDMQQIINTAMEPLLEKPIGPGAITIGALFASRYLKDYGWGEEELALAAAQNHANAARNPYAHLRKGWTFEDVMNSPMLCWPLREYEICPASAGAACVVLAAEDRARDLAETPVWIEAISSTADTMLSGYRDYRDLDLLERLRDRVYSMCGISNPLDDFDVAEVFNPFSIFDFLVCDALGFCERGRAPELYREGATSMDGRLPVNPSGGVLCTNSGMAASLTRFAEVALQLMGKAGERQVKGNPRRGIAHAWGGSDCQFNAIGILSRD